MLKLPWKMRIMLYAILKVFCSKLKFLELETRRLLAESKIKESLFPCIKCLLSARVVGRKLFLKVIELSCPKVKTVNSIFKLISEGAMIETLNLSKKYILRYIGHINTEHGDFNDYIKGFSLLSSLSLSKILIQ